jgi:hypothetical protein
MMSSNAIVFGWNRSLPGREQASGKHFQDFVAYLQAQQAAAKIESFEPVLLEPHGGTFNGFFLIKGSVDQLDALANSPDWVQHQVRATLHLDGTAVCRAVAGSAVNERMGMWMQAIPR